jgi:cytochrome P450
MFDAPDVFDPDRFLRPAGWTRYSPFGLPPRICPGAHLSRAIGRHVTAELAGGYTMQVRDAEPVEFGGFHWKPSSRLRASLQARA